MPRDSPSRIETLDGLRAVSIALVLFSHTLGTGVVPMLRHAHVFGQTGVRTFFVISGFLITTLLLRERERAGRISLGAFYVRRAFRIFPAFYVYLGVIAGLSVAGLIEVGFRDFAFAGSYTMNFHEDRAWYLGHLWSLAVEEQFYLIWPLAMVVLGTRRAAWFAIGAIMVAPAARITAWYEFPEIGGLTDQAFPFVFDALASGCVLAICRTQLESSPRYRRLHASQWFWWIPAVCVASLVIERPWFELGLGTTAANLGIALAIHHCVMFSDGPVGRLLEQPRLVWVGTLSYSLYLWQQPFVNRHASAWFCKFPVNLVLGLAAATLSYYIVEQPALRLGRRFTRRSRDMPGAP